MADELHRIFLDCSIDRLRQNAGRVESCLGKLTADQIWARGSENENAIGNLVLHLCGNVRQWIGAGIGRQPDMRQRDKEFAARGGLTAAELGRRLREVVEEAAAVLTKVTPEQLAQRITVQKYDVTILEGIYHVVEHFAGHTGQIIFATKILTGSDLGFYRHLSPAPPPRPKP